MSTPALATYLDAARLAAACESADGQESSPLQIFSDACLAEGLVFAPVREPQQFLPSLAAQNDEAAKKLQLLRKKGTTTLAFVFREGVLVAVDSRASMGSYVSSQAVRKILPITEKLVGTMAGGAADCQFWETHLGRLCRLYELRHREEIPVSAAASMLATIMWNYRNYDLSCGTMICGWDARQGPQIFYVDSDGTKVEAPLFSVGSGSTYAYSVLDTEYKFDLTLSEAVELGRRAIVAATHRDGGSGGLVRVYHVRRDKWVIIEDGQDASRLMWDYRAKEKW